MKLHQIAAALIALTAFAAQATGGGGQQPTGDCAGNNSANCNGPAATAIGTGTSEADARAAANALAQGGNAGVDFWAGLSNQQRQALMSNQAFTGTLESNPQLSAALSNYSPSSATAYGGEGGQGGQGGMAQARQALMSSLSNYSPSSSRSAATGGSGTGGSGVGTVTVDGRVYYPAIPVSGAVISAAQSIAPSPSITVVKSGCVGQVDITDKRTLEATRGTLMGLFSWGYANGFEQQVRAKTDKMSKLQYGNYAVIGYDDKGNPIEERIVEGFEYVIFAYVTGGGASSGFAHNSTSNATGLNGNMNNSSFGTNVMEFSCSYPQTRTLFPKPKDAPPPPPAAEKVWTLSYQIEQYKVVPVKGGKRPAVPARTVKDSTRRIPLASITVTCEGKGDKPAACPGKPAPGSAIDMTGK